MVWRTCSRCGGGLPGDTPEEECGVCWEPEEEIDWERPRYRQWNRKPKKRGPSPAQKEYRQRQAREKRQRDLIRRARKPAPRPKKPPGPLQYLGRPGMWTECPNGHPYTKESTYIVPGGNEQGQRQCYKCMKARMRKYINARRASERAKVKAQIQAEKEARRAILLRPKMKGVSDADQASQQAR